MLNHVRSLLMNLHGEDQAYPETYPGDAVIPAEYRKIQLPDYLVQVREQLFGKTPDRTFLNYRVFQYLQLIEGTELREYVSALDPRITYNLNSSDLFLSSSFMPSVSGEGSTIEASLTVRGKAISPDATGKSNYAYRVYIPDGSTLSVDYYSDQLLTENYMLSYYSGLSPEYALPLSGYRVQLSAGSVGDVWRIQGAYRPTYSVAAILDLAKHLKEDYLLAVFQGDEPYVTFHNCWNSHPEIAYKLAGLVLAVAYKTEDVRSGK